MRSNKENNLSSTTLIDGEFGTDNDGGLHAVFSFGQEIADLVAADVRLENPPTVKVTGKGNKSLKSIVRRSYPCFRTVPKIN